MVTNILNEESSRMVCHLIRSECQDLINLIDHVTPYTSEKPTTYQNTLIELFNNAKYIMQDLQALSDWIVTDDEEKE